MTAGLPFSGSPGHWQWQGDFLGYHPIRFCPETQGFFVDIIYPCIEMDTRSTVLIPNLPYHQSPIKTLISKLTVLRMKLG
jgi:hypothetical protein